MTSIVIRFITEGLFAVRCFATAYVIALFRLKKKSGFIWHTVALFVALFALSGCISFVQLYAPENVAIICSLFWYILLMIPVFFAIKCCYKCSVNEGLHVLASGRMLEGIIYSIFAFVMLGIGDNIFTNELDNSMISLVLHIVMLIVGVAAFALLYKKFSGRDKYEISKSKVTTLLLIGIIILDYAIYCLLNFNRGTDNGWFSAVVYFIVSAMLFLFTFGLVRFEVLSSEKLFFETLAHRQEEKYRETFANHEMIDRKCHDIKRQLKALKFVSESERDEYIESVERMVSIYDSRIKTGNAVLDNVIEEKMLYCEQNGIRISVLADGKLLSDINAIALYTIIDNALENAVEAASRVTDEAKREITVKVVETSGFVLLQIANYFVGNLLFENGLPITDKSDKVYHGYGIKSIRATAENYGGNTDIFIDTDRFILNILFPQNKNEPLDVNQHTQP